MGNTAGLGQGVEHKTGDKIVFSYTVESLLAEWTQGCR